MGVCHSRIVQIGEHLPITREVRGAEKLVFSGCLGGRTGKSRACLAKVRSEDGLLGRRESARLVSFIDSQEKILRRRKVYLPRLIPDWLRDVLRKLMRVLGLEDIAGLGTRSDEVFVGCLSHPHTDTDDIGWRTTILYPKTVDSTVLNVAKRGDLKRFRTVRGRAVSFPSDTLHWVESERVRGARRRCLIVFSHDRPWTACRGFGKRA